MGSTNELEKLQFISGKKVTAIFNEIYKDILTIPYKSASDLVSILWRRYQPTAAALNGSVFEGILASILYRSGILPFHIQAKLSFIPNIDFDFVGYSKEYGPVVLSAKTSLRERYKQADLEGMMLKQVHRKSRNYLITLNGNEANTVNQKIQYGEVLGLDKVICAKNIGFDHLLKELKSLNFYHPEKIDIITSKRRITK